MGRADIAIDAAMLAPPVGVDGQLEGQAGDRFSVMMVQLTSAVFVVLSRGACSSSRCQPSSTANRALASKRPVGLLTEPQPLRALEARTSFIRLGHRKDKNIKRTYVD